MQNDLLEIPIKKSGTNKFGGFNYYELEDLLPPILKLCKEYGCTLYFDFPTDENGECTHGLLHLVNWEDKEDNIQVQVPFAQLEKLPKMNWAQSSGTYQTYMKRYLILHTFDIVEKETIDAIDGKQGTHKQGTVNDNKPKTVNKKKEKPSNVDLDSLLEKIEKVCSERYPDEEFNKGLLNKASMEMLKQKEITLDERKAIMNYMKSL